jgi:hypothetical protein
MIGSEDPWVEACVLEAGAKEIVTLDGQSTIRIPLIGRSL